MHALEWILEHGRYERQLDAGTLRRALQREPRQCTWCGEPAGRGRRTWCSQRCVDQFNERCRPQHVLYRIQYWCHGSRRTRWRELRCDRCGLDLNARRNAVEWMRRRLAHLRNRGSYGADHRFHQRRPNTAKQERRREILDSLLYRARCNKRLIPLDRWELDHVTPVCEGGGCCGPEGLRVLCLACHRYVTRELSRRRAARRKATA